MDIKVLEIRTVLQTRNLKPVRQNIILDWTLYISWGGQNVLKGSRGFEANLTLILFCHQSYTGI